MHFLVMIFFLVSFPVKADLYSAESTLWNDQPPPRYMSSERFKGNIGTSVIPDPNRNPFGGSIEEIVPPLKPLRIEPTKDRSTVRDSREEIARDIEQRRKEQEQDLRIRSTQ